MNTAFWFYFVSKCSVFANMVRWTQKQMDLKWGWILAYIFVCHPEFLKCVVSEKEINVSYDLYVVYL